MANVICQANDAHDIIVPTCCHAIVLIHGIRDDGHDAFAGGWFGAMAEWLRGGKSNPAGAVPPCTRIFGLTWRRQFAAPGYARNPDGTGIRNPDGTFQRNTRTTQPGFEQVTSAALHPATTSAGERLAEILLHLHKIIGSGTLAVMAHSQGTEVTGVALGKIGTGVLDAVVLWGSPIIPASRPEAVANYRQVPKMVNCASTGDVAMTAKEWAAPGRDPLGQVGFSGQNSDEKRQIPSSPSGDVFINSFGHSDWLNPAKINENPPLPQLLMTTVKGDEHEGQHRLVQDADVRTLRTLARKASRRDAAVAELTELVVTATQGDKNACKQVGIL